MSYWLVKSELSVYSIDDLRRDGKSLWTGVRNYQARNYLKTMKKGQQVLYYHSVDEPIGIVGIAAVVKENMPDPTQFDKKSDYFDPKATKEDPRWFCPELQFKQKFTKTLGLDILRQEAALKNMVLLKRGSRLSVQPVTEQEFNAILKLSR